MWFNALPTRPTEGTVYQQRNSSVKYNGVPEDDTYNRARVQLFFINRPQETLSSTSDAAKFHIIRSHYQASVWNQAYSPYPDLS